jgi:pilus assembly protein CpaF
VFSRFSKTSTPPRAGSSSPASTAPVEKPGLAGRVQQAPVSQKAAAEAMAADREKKRKERLTELKVQIHKRLLEDLNLSALENASEQQLKTEIGSLASEALDEMSVALNKDDRIALNQELYDEVMGLGPLEPLLKDETINDILVNGPKRIFVERAGKLELSDVTFRDERHLLRIIDKIVSAVGRRVDESNPYCDARLQDGSRFNCMIPPIAVDGSLVSIRKFKKDKLKVSDLVSFGAFTEEMAAYLQAAVSCRLNIVVSGGTGSGKTTTLNALSSFIDHRRHRRTSASAGPCGPDGKPPGQRRRQGRRHPARLSSQRAADAARPDHRGGNPG